MNANNGENVNGAVNASVNDTVNTPGIEPRGQVIPLCRAQQPTEEPGTELQPHVLEGELLTEQESAELDRRLAGQRIRDLRAVAVQRAATVARVVRESDKPATAGKAILREGLTVWQGMESWATRMWDASTMGVYRRQIKAAEATGDQERLAEWVDRKEQAQEHRHKRMMDMPQLAIGAAKVMIGGLAGLVVLVLMIGLFVQLSDAGKFTEFITGVMNVVRWVFTAIAFTWTPLLIAAPFMLLLGAWREGKRRGSPPAWLATARDAEADLVIDETTIALALDALRIPQISNYLKTGMPLQYLTPARLDGRGTHAVIRLPRGVTAEKIARRRADLATGLHRLATEVWPTTGSEAGILDLWVADKGALAEGAGPYPLLTDGQVDVFKGVPFGKTLRGEPIVAPLNGRNTITGGIPGQGKSSAARAIMAGAALDPTAELRIWVPDSNFDFEAFRPRCSRYVMGAENEDIAEILQHLHELHDEVQARGALLVRHEEPEVTRPLANKGIGLHPLVCLLEEAHVAIQHSKYGRDISQLLIDIVRLGRKRGIHLIVSTQAPTKDSMPRDVTRNCSNGIAFSVGDHHANDALLGQGAYAGGHRATELIPGTDRGTAVVKGFTGERSEIVQVYFIDVARKKDQITPIINRSMAAIAELGKVPGSHTEAPQIETERDLLQDLADVLGEDPVPAADVPALLARHAPRWAPYRGLTGKALRLQLAADYGVKVPSTGNKFPVDPVTIRHALVERAAVDQEDEP